MIPQRPQIKRFYSTQHFYLHVSWSETKAFYFSRYGFIIILLSNCVDTVLESIVTPLTLISRFSIVISTRSSPLCLLCGESDEKFMRHHYFPWPLSPASLRFPLSGHCCARQSTSWNERILCNCKREGPCPRMPKEFAHEDALVEECVFKSVNVHTYPA